MILSWLAPLPYPTRPIDRRVRLHAGGPGSLSLRLKRVRDKAVR